MIIKKKLIIEKVKQKDNEKGNFILFGYSESERGSSYRRLFRGTKKECIEQRRCYNAAESKIKSY